MPRLRSRSEISGRCFFDIEPENGKFEPNSDQITGNAPLASVHSGATQVQESTSLASGICLSATPLTSEIGCIGIDREV